MKTLFVHARSTLQIDLPMEEIGKLPRPIGVATNIQYLHRIQEIVDSVGGVKAGQVLGCHTEPAKGISNQVGCFLFIGSGKFHPLGIALSTGKPVYCFDPATKEFSRISEEEIDRHQRRMRGGVLKFLTANRVGLLVSTKSGQNLMKEALAFKKACTDKEVYIFVFETLDKNYLDNFTFIESWVNTACPRIPETDNPGMVNLQEVIKSCPQYGGKDYNPSPFLEKTLGPKSPSAP